MIYLYEKNHFFFLQMLHFDWNAFIFELLLFRFWFVAGESFDVDETCIFRSKTEEMFMSNGDDGVLCDFMNFKKFDVIPLCSF